MSRYCVALLAGLVATSPALASSWADGMFEELSKDFGPVPRGPTLTHPFRVKNNTKVPVSISAVRVSCSCVSATALKNYLAPGEETVVLARLDTTRVNGSRNVTIYVTFDRPQFQEVRLWVQANGRDDFTLSPDTLAFGQVSRGEAATATTTLRFYGNSTFKATEVVSESNYIQPAIKEIRRQESEVVYEVTAQVRKDVPVGKWYTDVWVKTNHPFIPQVRVPLTVEIESALTISPAIVPLGEVASGGQGEQRVIVRGARPFKIVRVEGTDERLTVRDGTKDSKHHHVLTVTLKGDKPGTKLDRTLKVVTDLEDDNVIEFKVTGNILTEKTGLP